MDEVVGGGDCVDCVVDVYVDRRGVVVVAVDRYI